MPKPKLAYAIWPWGLEKEQMIQGMKDIKEVGFNYCESVSNAVDLFRDNPQELNEIAKRCRVRPISFYFGNSGDYAKDTARIEQSLDFLATCKIPGFNVAGTRKNGGGATTAELKAELKTVQKIGQLCKPYGITPYLHPHINTLVMFEKDIDFMMQNTDPSEMFFGPDTAHLTLARCDPVEMCERYKKRIRFIHIKDVKKLEDGAEVPGSFKVLCEGGNAKQGFEVFSAFLELGEGTVDFQAIFKILESVNYDGYLTCELDESRFGNKESAAMSLKYLKAHGFN